MSVLRNIVFYYDFIVIIISNKVMHIFLYIFEMQYNSNLTTVM